MALHTTNTKMGGYKQVRRPTCTAMSLATLIWASSVDAPRCGVHVTLGCARSCAKVVQVKNAVCEIRAFAQHANGWAIPDRPSYLLGVLPRGLLLVHVQRRTAHMPALQGRQQVHLCCFGGYVWLCRASTVLVHFHSSNPRQGKAKGAASSAHTSLTMPPRAQLTMCTPFLH